MSIILFQNKDINFLSFLLSSCFPLCSIPVPQAEFLPQTETYHKLIKSDAWVTHSLFRLKAFTVSVCVWCFEGRCYPNYILSTNIWQLKQVSVLIFAFITLKQFSKLRYNMQTLQSRHQRKLVLSLFTLFSLFASAHGILLVCSPN